MNPFKPTAGKMPPVLIGRDSVMHGFEDVLDGSMDAPGLMLISGQSGQGKTVMLTALGRIAADRSWYVVSDTASYGVSERLAAALVERGLGSTSISSAPAGLDLGEAIECRLGRMPEGKGVLFTIDEMQAASEDDLAAIADAIEHVDEEMQGLPDGRGHGVAFVFAGLPSMVNEVLNDKRLAFLRRARQQVLGGLPLTDVCAAYIEAVRESGKQIGQEDALAAAEAAAGYPYMVQLVGYCMWQSAERRGSSCIEHTDVERGIGEAVVAYGDAVCAPLMDGLTPAQREFVKAVAVVAPAHAAVSDIAKRCRRSPSWASKYRASLIKERVIEPDGRGFERLTVPHLADYLRKSSAAYGCTQTI